MLKYFFRHAIKIFWIYFTQHDIWKFVHKIDSLIKWFRSRSHYTPLGKFYSSALCFVNQKLQHLKWFSGTLKLSYVNVVSSFSKLPGGWLTHSTSRKLGVKGKNLRKIESCFLCEIRRAGGGGVMGGGWKLFGSLDSFAAVHQIKRSPLVVTLSVPKCPLYPGAILILVVSS